MLTQPPPKLFQPAAAWTGIVGLVLLVLLCLVGHLGGLLRIAFPAASFLVGSFLYFRYPILYIGFVWWMWFLTPLVRRLVDLNAGWVDPSPVLLAPFLVTLISLLTFFRQLPKAITGNGLPFVLSMIGVGYGFLIGLLSLGSPTGTIVALLNWLAPVSFGYHLFSNWRRFPEVKQIVQRVFLIGVLTVGGYGVVQFLVAPAWDRFWLENLIAQLNIVSFGKPEPLQIRVFSTMHSPQPFACFMMAGVLLLLSIRSPLKIVASAAGYLSLLLSLARAAWLSWIVGIVVFLPSLKPKLQMRLITTLMLMMLVVLPLTTIEPFSSVINTRVQTVFSGNQDTSYLDRAQGFTDLFDQALGEVSGRGIGYVIQGASIGSNDSGVLTLLLTLGWIGTVPYLAGLMLIVMSILQGREAAADSFVSACRAIALAMFAQISLNTVMSGPFGIVLWSFLGLAVAARVYYLQQAQNPIPQLPLFPPERGAEDH